MGDSSCGSSTPLKSLVDHGAQDRSLHQDRYSAASRSRHGFRTIAPNSSTQAQNAFGAFLDSNGSSPFPAPISDGVALQLPHLTEQHGRSLYPSPFQSAPQIPTPASFRGAHVPQQQINALPGASNWAQDFARFSQGDPSARNHVPVSSNMQQQPYRPVVFAPNTMVFPAGNSFFGSMGEPAAAIQQGATNVAATVEADFDLEMDRWMAAHGDGQIEDVDAIMEELALQMEQEHAGISSRPERQSLENSASTAEASVAADLVGVGVQNQQSEKQATADDNGGIVHEFGRTIDSRRRPDHLPDMSQLGINETTKMTFVEADSQGQSNISEAARQILESVQHEQGDKWKNSRFLLLMKDFRDGNKDIVDNEILETRTDGDRPSEQTTTAGS